MILIPKIIFGNNLRVKNIKMSYDKQEIITTMKDLLAQCDNAKNKDIKKEFAIQILNYLFNNLEFVNHHERFRKTVVAKCREFKKQNNEFLDLMNSADKLLIALNEPLQDPFLEKCKEMEHVYCEDGISVFEHVKQENLIIKYDSIFRNYKRDDLIVVIQKTGKLPNGEVVVQKDLELFKNKDLIFFEMINTGENLNILLPYETKTFINKYKI
jgi:hypothetical protein